MIPSWYLVQFHIGPIPVNVWGVFVALGFIVATWLAARMAPRHGFAAKDVVDFAVWAIVAGMIGARIGHVVFYEPAYYLAHPWQVFAIWEGGLSSFGGFVGALVAAVVFVRRRLRLVTSRKLQAASSHPTLPPLPAGGEGSCTSSPSSREGEIEGVGVPLAHSHTRTLVTLSDLLLWPLTLGWFIGRLGCYSIHDHPGIPCNGFLCVPFPDGTRRLDMGLLDGLLALAIFFVVLVWRRGDPLWSPVRSGRGRCSAPTGMTSALIIGLYGVGRFVLDFFRVGDATYAGFTPAQIGSIAMVIGALIIGARVWSAMRHDPMRE